MLSCAYKDELLLLREIRGSIKQAVTYASNCSNKSYWNFISEKINHLSDHLGLYQNMIAVKSESCLGKENRTRETEKAQSLAAPSQQGVFIDIPRNTGLLLKTELLTSKSHVISPSVEYLLLKVLL